MPWNPNNPGATAQQDTDRAPASSLTTVVPSAARTANGNSGTGLVAGSGSVGLGLTISAASGTSPTLVVSVEWSNDGTTFGPADPVDAFGSKTAAGRWFKNVTVKGRFFRLAWTVGGTTPSFTFAVTAQPLN